MVLKGLWYMLYKLFLKDNTDLLSGLYGCSSPDFRPQKEFLECIAIETVTNVNNELINKAPLFMLSNFSHVAFVLTHSCKRSLPTKEMGVLYMCIAHLNGSMVHSSLDKASFSLYPAARSVSHMSSSTPGQCIVICKCAVLSRC